MTRGGEGEIRTREACEGLLAFQASALDHYATSPWSESARTRTRGLVMPEQECSDVDEAPGRQVVRDGDRQ